MHVVILGAGSVGFQIAKQLIAEKKDVAIIEKDPKVAKYASNYLDCMVINDTGNNIDTLEQAGIDKADFFISVTDSDEMNMISCGLISNNSGAPKKIARVRNFDYTRSNFASGPFLGIDHIVNPEVEASKVIIRSIEHGALSDILFFESSRFQMQHMTITSGSLFNDTTLKDVKKKLPFHYLVAFILRDNDYLIPSGDTVLREGDLLYFIATRENLENIFTRAGKFRIDLNKIVIAGGGRIGSYVADHLLRNQQHNISFLSRITSAIRHHFRKNVVIIDNDIDTCNALAERFSDALIINEDISDEMIYEEGQLNDYDLIITTTDNQELNLVSAVYAKTLGIKRSIAVVNKNSYINIASKLGIDVTVSQKNSMVNSILKLVRRGNIKNIYSFAGGMLEVIELLVENASLSGSRIRDLKLPDQTLVVSITRQDENYLPNGDSVIQDGDHIIVIAKKESILKIESLFTGRQ